MILDMFGENYSRQNNKFYILDRVLAHPERIAGRTGPAVAGSQSGPTGRDPVNFNPIGFGPISVTPARASKAQKKLGISDEPTLAMVEGKFSATPQGSARTLDHIDLRNDYIQKKEASILSRWLARTLTPAVPAKIWSLKLEALRHNDTAPRIDLISTTSIAAHLPATLDKAVYDSTFTALKTSIQTLIPDQIQRRMDSFDAM